MEALRIINKIKLGNKEDFNKSEKCKKKWSLKIMNYKKREIKFNKKKEPYNFNNTISKNKIKLIYKEMS